MVDAGGDIPASSSMRGTLYGFEQDFANGYNNHQYPFGDGRSFAANFGGHLAYRFRSEKSPGEYTYSHWSAFIGVQGTFFSVSDPAVFSNSDNNSFSILIATWTLGAEYTLGDPSDLFNAFGRVGLDANLISGSILYNYYFSTAITDAFRFGYEAEIGGRYNIPATPLAIEASVDYTDANLLGKNYVAPATLNNSNILRERALNDGANPNDPSDQSRTINDLSFRLGGRIWF